MRLAIALDTHQMNFWWARSASRMRPAGGAELLRPLSPDQLSLAQSFLSLLNE